MVAGGQSAAGGGPRIASAGGYDGAEWRRRLTPYAAPAALLVAQLVLLPVPLGTFAAGALAGLIASLAAVGLALVWRANRVINFATGDLGIVPATLAVLLADQWGWNYWACGAAGLAAAVVLGVVVEGLIIRRFFEAPACCSRWRRSAWPSCWASAR